MPALNNYMGYAGFNPYQNTGYQFQYPQLAASQNAQTAQILANNEAQTSALEQYLAPVPRPAYVVQNPSCCNNFGYNTGCGCGR